MTQNSAPLFHLAFPCLDLKQTSVFYHQVLGCEIGRCSDRWVDFDLYGHQITAHRVDQISDSHQSLVDGQAVPAFHFGLILELKDWQDLRDRLQTREVSFLIEPQLRFPGQDGEQHTMFVTDPNGHGLEFKSFH